MDVYRMLPRRSFVIWIPLILVFAVNFVFAANVVEKVKGKIKKPDTIVEVVIEGLADELLANAQAYLEIYQKREDTSLTDNWIKNYHEQAVKEIQLSLQPFGYYSVDVDASLQKNDKGKWVASYVVSPGSQVLISTIDLQWLGGGATEPELVQAANEFPLKVGQPLIHTQYEAAKDVLLEKAGLLGYHDVLASVKQVRIDPRRNTASIKLHLDTGEKFYLGSINITQDILEQEFVYKYLVDFHKGDPYSQSQLLAMQRSLVESGYFSVVDVKPQFDRAEEHQVPVDIKLSPAKRQTYAFGLGFNTDVGVNGTVRWQHRRLNTDGHRADALLRVSTVELLLRGGYWIPVMDPRFSKLGFTTKLESNENDSSDWISWENEAGFYHEIEDWKLKLFTNILWEEYSAGTEPKEETLLLSLGGQAEKIAFEEGNYPRRGWSLFSSLRGSPGVISSTDYLRLHLKGRGYFPILARGRLLLRGEIGAARVGDFEKYPVSLRFFAGGDQSVRGYEYESLGPTDSGSTQVVGGKHIFTSTVEYDQMFSSTWGGAVFVDAGNAYNDKLDKLFVGAGVGVRYLSPVGMVRVDFAWPMNKNDNSPEIGEWRLHFGFEVNL